MPFANPSTKVHARSSLVCHLLIRASPEYPPPAPTNNMARSSARHRGAFQAAKWGCGVIVLDVRVCVFCLQIPHIVARRGGLRCVCVCVCQQGCAAWDKLRQVTTGGRREECGGGLRLQEFCACFSAYSRNQTHLRWRCGIEFYALRNFPDSPQLKFGSGMLENSVSRHPCATFTFTYANVDAGLLECMLGPK